MSLLFAALALLAPIQDAPAAAPAPDYRDDASWLCRPGRDDACARNLDATVIAADGTRRIERFVPAADPQFDCFYVYPTVSNDPGGNSDMIAGEEERRTAHIQAARFGSKCRVYAPLYRQATLTALRGGQETPDRALAYRDVQAAWETYLAQDNGGRGVVLIGHSQGAALLRTLLQREIEGKPVAERLISAMLIGTTVPVLEGQDSGLFRTIPLCRRAEQFGCIVTYASFRAESPPPPNSGFGKADRPGAAAGCTNPAALGGGRGEAQAYLSATASSLVSGPAGEDPRWTVDGAPVVTPFVRVPGLISLECVRDGAFTYLAVTVNADPDDPRTDTISGDVKLGDTILYNWGLHLIDMDVAMGDLVALAERQAEAWRASR